MYIHLNKSTSTTYQTTFKNLTKNKHGSELSIKVIVFFILGPVIRSSDVWKWEINRALSAFEWTLPDRPLVNRVYMKC